MNLMFVGDIVGRPGRDILLRELPGLKEEFSIDCVIANGENAASGFGITPKLADSLLAGGVDALTMGNHVWAQKEIYEYLDVTERIIRPANMPENSPGRGYMVFDLRGVRIGLVNIIGVVFMKNFDDPFQVADSVVEELSEKVDVIIVDIHAEATSEKIAMGYFLDGRVTAVLGTHTHIQTADEKILPGGTAYMTDIGMTGPSVSVLGVQKELVLEMFLTRMPVRWRVSEEEPIEISAAIVDMDEKSGRSRSIQRFRREYILNG